MNMLITTDIVQNRIIGIRGQQVMIDRDLAEFYGVRTDQINDAVKRNPNRFPERYLFKLTETEKRELVAESDRYEQGEGNEKSVRFDSIKHSAFLPWVFTRRGCFQLAGVLKSKRADEVSVKVLDAFEAMYDLISRLGLGEPQQPRTVPIGSLFDRALVIMVHRNLYFREVAVEIGRARNTVSSWFNGSRKPSRVNVKRLELWVAEHEKGNNGGQGAITGAPIAPQLITYAL